MTLRTRMWIEAALAGIATVLTVVTLIWPTWIELFDESPDAGDGSAERVFALVWIAAAVVFGRMARRHREPLRQTRRPAALVDGRFQASKHLART